MLQVLIKISPWVIVFYRKNPTKIPSHPANLRGNVRASSTIYKISTRVLGNLLVSL